MQSEPKSGPKPIQSDPKSDSDRIGLVFFGFGSVSDFDHSDRIGFGFDNFNLTDPTTEYTKNQPSFDGTKYALPCDR